MAEMEHGLNMIAGGKPFKTSVILDNGYKPNCHEKDIDDYNGKWAMMFFEKSGTVHKSVHPLVYDTKELAQSDIDYVFKGHCDLSNSGNFVVKFEDLSHGFPIPMPVKKGTA